jgi:hypothetical protein
MIINSLIQLSSNITNDLTVQLYKIMYDVALTDKKKEDA